MNTSILINILRNFKAESAKKYGIIRMGLFGSFARNQQLDESDIDVFVELEEPDFFTLIRIQEELEKLTKKKVDVIRFRESLRESLKKNIQQNAIYI